MTQEQLVEKVALDIRNASCLTPTYPFNVFDPNEAEANIREWCRYAAQAAIDVVLEEAAKVCDELRHPNWSEETGKWVEGTEACAAAIRALGATGENTAPLETRQDADQARSRSDER